MATKRDAHGYKRVRSAGIDERSLGGGVAEGGGRAPIGPFAHRISRSRARSIRAANVDRSPVDDGLECERLLQAMDASCQRP